MSLPQEIQDRIICEAGFLTAISTNNKYAIDQTFVKSFHTWSWAAKNGYLGVIKWLHNNKKHGCGPYVMDYAAKNGHLHIIKWLHENRTEGCTRCAMDEAAWFGHLKIVKYLHDNRSEG